MKLNRYAIGALLFALLACNPPQQSDLSLQNQVTVDSDSNNCSSDNTSKDLLTMSIGELLAYKEQRQDEDSSNTGTLQKNSAVIKGLCAEVVKRRSSCVLANRIIADGSDDSLSCSAAKTQPPGLFVRLSPDWTGNYVLVGTIAGSTVPLISTPFTSGTHVVKFSASGAAAQRSGRFLDLIKVVIRSADEKWQDLNLPDINSGGLEVLYGTNKLFGGGFSPIAEAKGTSEYLVDISSIATQVMAQGCVYDLATINGIKSRISQPFEQAQAQALAANQAKKAAEQKQYAAMHNDSLLRCKLINEVKAFEVKITKDTPTLEQNIDNIQGLTNELKSVASFGCMANQAITSMNVSFIGRVVDEQHAMTGNKVKSLEPGSSNIITLKFGEGLSASSIDARGVIPGGKFEFDQLNNVAIGAFDRVYIEKKGFNFTNLPQSCNTNGGIGGNIQNIFWNQTCYIPTEQDVMFIDEIKIVANGKVLFSQKSLGIKLFYGQHSWEFPDDVQKKPEWQALMAEPSCTAQ